MIRRALLPASLLACLGLLPLALAHCGGGAPEPKAPPTPITSAPIPPPASSTADTAPTTTAVTSVAPSASVEAPKGPPHWTYEGDEGPEKWGDLSADFATCKTGSSQTPIDIVTKKAEKQKGLAGLVLTTKPFPLAIFNNGHTVQVSAPEGTTLAAAGDTWRLLQFHFHAPSEHTVDGKHFDAELHLVHKNDKGALAVVGVLLKKGKENKALAAIMEAMPAEVTKEAKAVDGKTVDVSSFVTAKAPYFTYAGSLTTPPCTEGVTWLVMEKPADISEAQLAKFKAVTHGESARPVQPLGARVVHAFK